MLFLSKKNKRERSFSTSFALILISRPKHETYGYKCGECGHETPLEKLRPLFMHCKCGKSFSYKTNLTADRVTHTCLACKAPVDLELNSRKTAYVTVGERR